MATFTDSKLCMPLAIQNPLVKILIYVDEQKAGGRGHTCFMFLIATLKNMLCNGKSHSINLHFSNGLMALAEMLVRMDILLQCWWRSPIGPVVHK